MQRATIADVAARAGVTKSTVSHALSGKRPVAPETRDRIEQAIVELGYSPNQVAQRLASGRSRTIGFVYPLYTPQVGWLEMKFIAGAATVINQANYAFVLLTHPERQPDNLQRFVEGGLLDGVILMQVRLRDPRVELLQRAGVPFVLVGRCCDNAGLTFIDLDVDAALNRCVAHLVELDHTALAYLHQDDPEFGFAARATQAYADACRRFGLPVVMATTGLSVESGQHAMTALLARRPETTGVIVWNDIAGWGAAQAGQAQGRRIPGDLSIICFDHTVITDIVPFNPTVIDIRAEEMAAEAARMLIALLEDQPLAQHQMLVAPRFSVGDTTAPRRPHAY